MASIGWIDFSPTHRNRVGSVLDLLKPEGMVDELGMGTIRDALANEMFPGISTIQTRARYFFIIHYILYEYQAAKPAQRRGKSPSKFLEDREYEVMWQLAERYSYVEGQGVIGITKRYPEKIARRPSTIYWNGLNTYKFIDTQGLSAETFLNRSTNKTVESLLSSVQLSDDTPGDDRDAEHENLFRIKIEPKLDWNDNETLDLLKDEADFFNDRIISIAKNKLIAELLLDNSLWQIFTDANSFMQFAKAAVSQNISEKLKATLTLAHDFSELMYGSNIAYNCQLQQKKFNNNCYEEDWENWLQDIQSNMLDFENFNPDVLFGYATSTRRTTIQFVKEWWEQTQLGFTNLKKRDELIQHQELMVKRGKARLIYNKTDDVKENNWIGLTYFNYRYNQARTILNDIRTGLTN
jgi:hypothetical protein